MSTLREICSQTPVVVLDAASALVQVGVFDAEGPARWRTSTDESGIGVFQCLEQLRIDPLRVASWVYCEGPGSVLGVRTVAMALRTWVTLEPRPVYAYASLAVVAHAQRRCDLGVITDARRDTWHHFSVEGGLRRVATPDLIGDLVMPEGFRQWSILPTSPARVSYCLSELLPKVWDIDFLHLSDAPDAFLHEEPSYVTWSPKIHRAPAL